MGAGNASAGGNSGNAMWNRHNTSDAINFDNINIDRRFSALVLAAKSTYCGECLEDFKDGETVWYAWIENRSFCGKCKQKLDIKDWEKRIVKED